MRPIEFTAIEGLRVGHAENLEAATGCTIVISEAGATAGMDVRGGALFPILKNPLLDEMKRSSMIFPFHADFSGERW